MPKRNNQPDVTEVITNEALAGADPVSGTEGQDRGSYSDEQDRDSYAVQDDAPEEETPAPVEEAVPDMAMIRDMVHREAPYEARGPHVYDTRGRRVAICGHDGRVKESGPAIAAAVAASLNKFAGY